LRRHADGTEALAPMTHGADLRQVLDRATDLAGWRAIEAGQPGSS
jgi:hypothetical protein